MQPKARVRVAGLGLALVVGFLVGVAASFKVRAGLDGGFPYGLVAALALTAALVTTLRLLVGGRLAGPAGAVGVLVAALVLTRPSAGGSVVLPLDATGPVQVVDVVWLAGVAVLAVLGAAVPVPRARGPRAQEADGILTTTKGSGS